MTSLLAQEDFQPAETLPPGAAGPGLPGPLHTGPGLGSLRSGSPSRVGLSCRGMARLSGGRASISAVSHLEVQRELEEGQRRGHCSAGVTSALPTPAESGGWSQASPGSPPAAAGELRAALRLACAAASPHTAPARPLLAPSAPL